MLTDANIRALRKLKPVVLVTLLALLASGCSSTQHQYSYKFDEYQGFNNRNDFLTNSATSEERLKAEAERNLLSGNLFDAGEAPTKVASRSEHVLSENLFELASVQRKGSIYDRILGTAHNQIGTPYRFGGCNPNSGFDCSGFTTWVFNRYGVHLPRSSREQYQVGKKVAKNNLRKGDLVFFRSRRGISHVGIYLENGKFIHSASNGKTVTISRLDEAYWRTHYAGGRRVF